MSIEKADIEKVIRKIDIEEQDRKRAEKIIKAVLDIIPKGAMEVFLKDKDKFLNILISAFRSQGWHFKKGSDEDITYKLADSLADEFIRKLDVGKKIFGEEAWNNSYKLLFLSSLAYAGYLKLNSDAKINYPERHILVYLAKKYKNLENLEERLSEGREWLKLYYFYQEFKQETDLPFKQFVKQFVFFIEKAYEIKVKTYDGKEIEPKLTNINNPKEINQAFASRSFHIYKQQGKEILNTLKEKFPFTKILEQIDSKTYFQLALLLGTYSKEKFFKAFRENYMDLIRRTGDGLEENPFVIVSAINRTLFNQKDFFLCNIYEIAIPPNFPKELKYRIPNRKFVVKNGYEYLAFELLYKLPEPAFLFYLNKYQDNQSKMFDLRLVSYYYKYVKSLKNYDEKTLNSFFNIVEKMHGKKLETIMDVWT